MPLYTRINGQRARLTRIGTGISPNSYWWIGELANTRQEIRGRSLTDVLAALLDRSSTKPAGRVA